MARYWAIGPSTTQEESDGMVEQMQELGATPAQIEQFKKENAPDECLVLEENQKAAMWFLEVSDLFRFTDSGFAIGLDVSAIESDAKMIGREINPKNYTKLRIIGRHASIALNEKRSK